MKILVINGPNLNLLGTREPEKYGHITLEEIQNKMQAYCQQNELNIEFFQSNSEGAIIDFIQKKAKTTDYLILNAGALTHTSIALRDTILGLKLSTIEVHLTNIYSREEFRKISYISDIAIGIVSGFGWYSYMMALDYINNVPK